MPSQQLHTWMLWRLTATKDGRIAPDILARIAAERARIIQLKVTTRTIPLTYVEDTSVPARFIDVQDRLQNPFRRVATLSFNDSRIDLDWIGGTGGGPGFSFDEVRFFVDFELRGWARRVGSSIGIGGDIGPAGALLRDDLALVLSDGYDRVYLRAAQEPGTR